MEFSSDIANYEQDFKKYHLENIKVWSVDLCYCYCIIHKGARYQHKLIKTNITNDRIIKYENMIPNDSVCHFIFLSPWIYLNKSGFLWIPPFCQRDVFAAFCISIHDLHGNETLMF